MRYADGADADAIILDSTFLSYSSIANQDDPGRQRLFVMTLWRGSQYRQRQPHSGIDSSYGRPCYSTAAGR